MTDQDSQDKVDQQPKEENKEKKAAEKPPEAPKAEEVKKEKEKAEPKKQNKPLSKNLEKIIEEIEKLSVLELSELVKALEEKFGVSAQAMVTPAAGVAGAGSEEASPEGPSEEQTIFNVILTATGDNKIGVIKAVRELVPTLGLKEAKDLAEAAPKEVLSGVNKATAEEAKKKLAEAGAQVELK